MCAPQACSLEFTPGGGAADARDRREGKGDSKREARRAPAGGLDEYQAHEPLLLLFSSLAIARGL